MNAVPQLLGGYKLRSHQFTPAPDETTSTADRPTRIQDENENFGYHQRADLQANTARRNVHDRALDPRRVRLQDNEAGPGEIHAGVLARIEAMRKVYA
jgi:hypothetical protein